MSGRYYNPIPGSRAGPTAVEQNAERVWQTNRDVANMSEMDPSYAPKNKALRRVNAAQGEDLSQRLDPFGHNRFSDAANPWAGFFGAPTAPWKTASYDKYDRNNYNLPEAYKGENLYLGKTIDMLIYQDETFYTQVRRAPLSFILLSSHDEPHYDPHYRLTHYLTPSFTRC